MKKLRTLLNVGLQFNFTLDTFVQDSFHPQVHQALHDKRMEY